VLTTQGSDCLDVGEADETEFDRYALMREGVPDAPGKRARPAAVVADALIHDQAHIVLLRYGPDRPAAVL
jgi:hypothetical protein